MKTILTVIGQDKPGIIAGISQQLFELNINILDVSQTIMGDSFTMIMALDCTALTLPFSELKTCLQANGERLGVTISIQRQEIFDAMHHL